MKVFEDYFSELQADMVAICLEYVDNKAEDIFIYCSYEPKMYVFDFFYKINGQIVHKDQLNRAVKGMNGDQIYDVSKERQKQAHKIGKQNLQDIHKKCEEYNQEITA